jgi:hypothetical protein
MKAEQTCRNGVNDSRALYLDADKTRLIASSAECTQEWKTASAIAKLGQKTRAKIAQSGCDGATLPALQLCAATVDGLVDASGTGGCLIDGHDRGRLQSLRKQYCDLLICP